MPQVTATLVPSVRDVDGLVGQVAGDVGEQAAETSTVPGSATSAATVISGRHLVVEARQRQAAVLVGLACSTPASTGTGGRAGRLRGPPR